MEANLRAPLKLPHPRDRIQHVIQIDHWTFDYMFGIDDTKFRTGPYYDYRHLELRGAIICPAGTKAQEATVTCFPDEHLMQTEIKKAMEARPVGYVTRWGKDYSATLHMPADMAPLVLQMLIAKKYRFIAFESAKGAREASIFNFGFSENSEDD
jgi:hypothetical protein